MKTLALALLAFSTLAPTRSHAEQEVISGTWLDRDYQFAMSDEYQDVLGSWGDSRYELVWDSDYNLLKGETAGVQQQLEFDDDNNWIFGESYCGWIDLSYTESDTAVDLTGTSCLESVEQSFATKHEMLDWIKAEILPELLSEFPEPARLPVHAFLSRIMQPFGQP
jgi:hypothetical protein